MTIDELIERLEDYRDELGGEHRSPFDDPTELAFRKQHLRTLLRPKRSSDASDDEDEPDDDELSTSSKANQLGYGDQDGLGRGELTKPKLADDAASRGGWFPPPDDGSQNH